MGALDDLTAAATDLYALPPEEFVAARTARVRQARADGDRELATRIDALVKPSVAAWILNQLSRRRPDAVDQLVAVGNQLRAAQRSLAGDQLRELSRRRQAGVSAFSRQAAALADELGRPLGAAVLRQVEDTVRAAVNDAGAGDALLRGRLTTALSYVGLGEVDASAATALPSDPRSTPTPPSTAPAGRQPDGGPDVGDQPATARRRRDAARQHLADTEAEAQRAVHVHQQHEEEVHRLRAGADEIAGRLRKLGTELERLEAEAEEVEVQLGVAESSRDESATTAQEAQAAVDSARSALDGLP